MLVVTRGSFSLHALLDGVEALEGDIDLDELESLGCWDEDDDDGPVIIPYEDVKASIARSTLLTSCETINQQQLLQVGKAQQQQCEKYPLLYAAMSSGEDEVMACARILDEARDVSLVREAAAYLEEVEVHREWGMWERREREKRGASSIWALAA